MVVGVVMAAGSMDTNDNAQRQQTAGLFLMKFPD
jgi:hypothetical protein